VGYAGGGVINNVRMLRLRLNNIPKVFADAFSQSEYCIKVLWRFVRVVVPVGKNSDSVFHCGSVSLARFAAGLAIFIKYTGN